MPLSNHDLSRREFRRILLIKPTALGDVVHTVPVLVKLRRRFPAARIDWLITPENAELVRAHPALSGTVLFDRRAFRAGWWGGLWKTLKMLRELSARAVRSHDRSARAAPVRVICRGDGCGSADRVRPARGRAGEGDGTAPRHGWAGARELSWLASNVRIPIPVLAVHAIDRSLWLAPLLGLDDAPPEGALHLAPAVVATAQSLLAPLGDREFVVLAPGTLWETKHWRQEGFAEVARRLAEQGTAVVVTGTGADAGRAATILAAAPAALDLCGRTTPGELASVLKRARLCVTNDSGAMHLAVAVGVPVVAIFGPTNPVQVGPYGQAENVVRAGVECSPCYLRRLAQCPHEHACMQSLTAENVWERVAAILAR